MQACDAALALSVGSWHGRPPRAAAHRLQAALVRLAVDVGAHGARQLGVLLLQGLRHVDARQARGGLLVAADLCLHAHSKEAVKQLTRARWKRSATSAGTMTQTSPPRARTALGGMPVRRGVRVQEAAAVRERRSAVSGNCGSQRTVLSALRLPRHGLGGLREREGGKRRAHRRSGSRARRVQGKPCAPRAPSRRTPSLQVLDERERAAE